MVDPTKILTRSEFTTVLADLRRRAKRSRQSRGNLVLFRLACCCGIRVTGIAHLLVGDIHLAGARPYIHVRHGKGYKKDPKTKQPLIDPTTGEKIHKEYKVPLWLDAGTLADIREWVEGRPATEPVICSALGRPLTRSTLARRWQTALRALGPERVRQLSIHKGRHTACTVWCENYDVVKTCQWAGHSNISTTHTYLHVSWEDVEPQDLFGRAA